MDCPYCDGNINIEEDSIFAICYSCGLILILFSDQAIEFNLSNGVIFIDNVNFFIFRRRINYIIQ